MAKIPGNIVGLPSPRSDWNQTNEAKADYIKNKPTKLSQFENDSKFVTDAEIEEAVKTVGDKYYATKEEVNTALGDIESAFDELHAYAQALINGGAE